MDFNLVLQMIYVVALWDLLIFKGIRALKKACTSVPLPNRPSPRPRLTANSEEPLRESTGANTIAWWLAKLAISGEMPELKTW